MSQLGRLRVVSYGLDIENMRNEPVRISAQATYVLKTFHLLRVKSKVALELVTLSKISASQSWLSLN